MRRKVYQQVKIREGAMVWSDLTWLRWRGENDVVFAAEEERDDKSFGWKLIAPGYGLPGMYGSGAIRAKADDLIFIIDTPCKGNIVFTG